MQRLGQHFLKNQTIIEKIIAAIDVPAMGTVVEIGPGRGALTLPLADACAAAHCRLIAIEKDPLLAEKIAKEGIVGTAVTQGDALKILPDILRGIAAQKDDRHCAVVGNLPYYITGKLFRLISESEEKPDRCVFMVQREVAARICALPGFMNRLAASVQFWAEPRMICRVPSTDFTPPPKVESAVIAMDTRLQMPSVHPEQYYAAVRALFSQPRKTILNNLAHTGNRKGKDAITKALARIGIDPSGRPQDLSLAQIVGIATAFWG